MISQSLMEVEWQNSWLAYRLGSRCQSNQYVNSKARSSAARRVVLSAQGRWHRSSCGPDDTASTADHVSKRRVDNADIVVPPSCTYQPTASVGDRQDMCGPAVVNGVQNHGRRVRVQAVSGSEFMCMATPVCGCGEMQSHAR